MCLEILFYTTFDFHTIELMEQCRSLNDHYILFSLVGALTLPTMQDVCWRMTGRTLMTLKMMKEMTWKQLPLKTSNQNSAPTSQADITKIRCIYCSCCYSFLQEIIHSCYMYIHVVVYMLH